MSERARKIPGAGDWTYREIHGEDDYGIVHIRVSPPLWVAKLALSESAAVDNDYLSWTVDYAAHDLAELILKDPVIAEHVERLVERARAEAYAEARRS